MLQNPSFLFLANFCFAEILQSPDDKSDAPITIDDLMELFNQLSIYIGRKEFKKNFREIVSFLKNLLSKWKKWQKVWKNRITHYTLRVDPQHPDVEIEGVIEIWNPKKPKGEQQITTVKMFITKWNVRHHKVEWARNGFHAIRPN